MFLNLFTLLDGVYLVLTYNPSTLNLVFYYHADDWIFIKTMYILIDGVSYNTNIVAYDETDTNVGSSGTISETVTLEISPLSTENRKNIVEALSNATSVSVKLYGSNGSEELDMSSSNIEAMKDTISLYNEFILRD